MNTTPNGQRYCTIPGCDRPHHARGLCQAHYRRRARRESTLETVPVGELAKEGQRVQRRCRIHGCDRPHVARGLCGTHYQASRRAYRGRAVLGHIRVRGT